MKFLQRTIVGLVELRVLQLFTLSEVMSCCLRCGAHCVTVVCTFRPNGHSEVEVGIGVSLNMRFDERVRYLAVQAWNTSVSSFTTWGVEW